IRIIKRLLIVDTVKTIKSALITNYHKNCSSCSNFSVCIGYDIDLSRNICVCPLNRTDSRCLISFDPCTEVSPNRHGQCVPVDECYDSTIQFRCVCNPGWSINYCEKRSASINMSFVDEIKMPSVKIALIHLILPQFVHLTYFQ
ncbi:unnamed protein product, partial [Rotaria magnacalcarata]